MKIQHCWIILISLLGFTGCMSQLSTQSSAVNVSETNAYDESACTAENNCEVAAASCDENSSGGVCNVQPKYGGIKQQYVVEGCKVTIYNDGPIRMVDEQTDEPCDAPIPKDHQFTKETRSYQEDGCTVTESVAANGLAVGTTDCSVQNIHN